MLLETIDNEFFPNEIDLILEKASLIVPALKRIKNPGFYPANARKMVPTICFDDVRCVLVANLINDMTNW